MESEGSQSQKPAPDVAAEVAEMKRIISALKTGNKNPFLIDPRNSKHLASWDAFVGLLLCYTALVTPFEVAFLPVPTVVNGRFIVNRIVDIAFVVDMTLQVCVALALCTHGARAHAYATRRGAVALPHGSHHVALAAPLARPVASLAAAHHATQRLSHPPKT